MGCRFTEIAVDCRDAPTLARFWAEALGYHVILDDDDPDVVEVAPWVAEPPDRRARLVDAPGPPTFVFINVPEGKTAKNRMHVDVNPTDRSTEEEVERLLALGATRVDVGQTGDESWIVLADPEGNEFCVLRPLV